MLAASGSTVSAAATGCDSGPPSSGLIMRASWGPTSPDAMPALTSAPGSKYAVASASSGSGSRCEA